MKWQRRSLAYWKQRIFYVISFFLIAGVFFAFGKDAAIIVTGILIGLNICLGRKNRRLRGLLLMIPLCVRIMAVADVFDPAIVEAFFVVAEDIEKEVSFTPSST